MAKSTSIAKITKPRLPDVLPRTRLFRLLDRTRKTSPVIWVSGPAGSGKTTLIANYLDAKKLSCLWYQADGGDNDIGTFFYYMSLAAKKAAPRVRKPLPLLTSEYLQDVPTFSKRYFENLCGRLQIPFIMVFDNYQEIPPESPFHKIFQIGVSSIPEGVSVVIISRTEPLPYYAGDFANNRMHVIGWEDLRLSSNEAKQIIRIKAKRLLPDGTVQSIVEKTQGWAAGIVLMAEQPQIVRGDKETAGSFTPERIFQYFTNELFDRADRQTQEFLLKTVLLPKITVAQAEVLTGMKRSSEILVDLAKRYFFTISRPGQVKTYEYHPLFREYLTSRARQSYTHLEFQALQRQAAALLKQSGQIEDAAELLIQSGGWEELTCLALSNAQDFISQGRSHAVEKWLNSIPEAFMERDPWLNYWLGICKITVDLHDSRKRLEHAFEMFKTRKDVAGLYLSWSGVIDTFVYEWGDFTPLDCWIPEIEALLREYPAFPSPEIEARVIYGLFCALMYHQPDHPDFRRWAERATAIAMGSGEVRLRTFISSNVILYYSWWKGDTAKAALLVDSLYERVRSSNVDPLSRMVWLFSAAAYAWIIGENEYSLSLAKSGLELAEATGIFMWNFMLLTQSAFNALTLGELEAADQYLKKMSLVVYTGRTGDAFVYHWAMGWKCMCEGRFSVALDHELAGVKITREGGFPMARATLLQGAAEALIELGDFSRSRKYLDEAYNIGLSARSMTFEYQNSWLNALYYLRRGERKKALDSLRRLLIVSRENGIFNHAQWRSTVMTELFSMALEEGIEVQHVQKLIRLHKMVPTESQMHLENWPWPIRISTLGQFSLELDGKAVIFSGKTPKKPLELLKAIIALGGRDVREERLIDELWPEASGDLAYKSFEMALQRLRKLINSDKAIRRQDGLLALDDRYCSTDVWAFERLVSEAEKGGGGDREKRALPEKAIRLYNGHFLPTDSRQPWVTLTRERLRSKFLRLITKAGEQYEKNNEWKKAVECFERGLERDAVCEEFYQRLMICHNKLGHRTEAVKTYQRCRAALLEGLGLEPSSKTEDIHSSLINS